MKTRNTYIDLAKGVAIFLVVLGHCIQYGYSIDYYESRAFFENIVFKIIYSFHMPLFALISGYLFYFSLKKRNFFETIYNRFMTLGIPIITIGSLLFVEKIIGGVYWKNWNN